MEEWKEYRLIDVLDALIDYRGKTPKKTAFGVPLITAKIIKNGRIETPSEFISLNDYDSWMVRGFPKVGDVVLTTEAPLGEVAQLDDANIALAQRVVTLRGKSGVLDNTYLKYYFLSNVGHQRLKARETGTTVTGIKQSELREVIVDVPPYEIQVRISNILKSLDDKIEVNRKINENLEQQAQALFKSWFVDFEPFKNGEFVESELGMIPKGWRVGTLDEIIKEAESGSRPKGGAETDGVPSIGAEKIERFGVYDYSSEKYINNNYYVQMKRGHVKEGDVLLYKDGAYTGKSSMALDGFPYKECAVNEHVFLLRTEASRFQFYLYFLISYPDIKTMIHTLASAKAAQPGLNQKELLGLDITIPNEDIIKQFNDLISPYMHQIANNAKESRRLAELRDTLLPKLMSGELKVNEIEK